MSQRMCMVGASVFFLFLSSFVPFFTVDAATLTESSLRLDRMGAGVAAGASSKILVVIKPATVGSIAKVRLTWPTTNAFTVNGTPANNTASTSSLESTYQGESLTAPTVTSPASNVSGGAVTFDVTGMSSSTTLYGFYITGGITNPSAGNAGTHSVLIETLNSGGIAIDSQTVQVDTVATNGDQVTVTGEVPSAFNFALGSNSISLGTMDVSTRSSGTVTVDIDSNAGNGWIAWIRSEGGSAVLASAVTGDSISSTNTGSPVTTSPGTKGYVVDVSASQGVGSTGSLTIATEYDGDSTTSGGVISTTYEQIAQSTGQAASDTLTLKAIVAISAVTQAASDYTDTWEVVGAGNY